MGNSNSAESSQRPAMRPEAISFAFAKRLAKQLSGIELYTLKKTFFELAEDKDDLKYWTQDTLIKFLNIPDGINGVGDLIFKSSSFLAGFPFVRTLSPALLTYEMVVKVVAIYDRRYLKLMKDDYDHLKLIFMSFAVVENSPDVEDDREFTVDDLDNLDDLDLLESFDNLFPANSASEPYILARDLQAILSLLLSIYTFHPADSLLLFSEFFQDEKERKIFRQSATAMLRTMDYDVDLDTKITFGQFKRAISDHFPKILDPLGNLFDQFLFRDKDPIDMQKSPAALLPHGKILNPAVYSSLQLFLPENIGDFMKLYAGSENGFSLGAFESKVFRWHSPTVLLVSGTRATQSAKPHTLDEAIPPLQNKQRSSGPKKVVFGAFLTTPWRISSKECFASDETTLFQLSPSFEVYHSSKVHHDYAYFSTPGQKKGGAVAGIGFGSSAPYRGGLQMGNVSLILDEALEYAVFRHVGLGGSFQSANGAEYEERFEIEEVEVWGIGRLQDLADQKKRLEWEQREARNRQHVNLKAASGGDFEEERALLEMAGIVGAGSRSGGSM